MNAQRVPVFAAGLPDTDISRSMVSPDVKLAECVVSVPVVPVPLTVAAGGFVGVAALRRSVTVRLVPTPGAVVRST